MKTIYVDRLRYVRPTDGFPPGTAWENTGEAEPEGRWEWVPEPETFDLEDDFGIDEGNLERELCRMGQILVRYGTIAGELQANLKRKEEHAKFIQARVAGALRSEYEKLGTRATEGKLSEEVIANDQYQQSLSALHLLRAESISADHWFRSAMKKAEMLNALAFRQNAELRRAYGSA